MLEKQIVRVIAIGWLLEHTSAAAGMILACVVPSLQMALSIAGPTLVLLLLSGGFFANVGQLPAWISWIQWISWFKSAHFSSKMPADTVTSRCWRTNGKAICGRMAPT